MIKPLVKRLIKRLVFFVASHGKLDLMARRALALSPLLERRLRGIVAAVPTAQGAFEAPVNAPQSGLTAEEARILNDLKEALSDRRRDKP